MGLFQKQPTTDAIPLYKMSGGKTLLIIGLGNIGKDYLGTRHNIGFEAIDIFALKNDFPDWISKKDLNCHFSSHTLGKTKVILIKPTTFMNQSGISAQAVQHFYRVYNPDTVVMYDELAVEFGSIRCRTGGESAGHNGIKSLIEHIGEDFGRIRIGIGSDLSNKAEPADFVLGKFTKIEQESIGLILQETNALINEFIFGGTLPNDTRNVL